MPYWLKNKTWIMQWYQEEGVWLRIIQNKVQITSGWLQDGTFYSHATPPLIWLRAIIINRPGVAGVILQTPHCVTKGSHLKKKSASIWNSSKRPWPPPPPCTFGTLWGTFLKPYFIWTKVPQSVWILAILPPFPWKMSKPKQKKYLIIFGIRQPPPLFLKNVQTQAEKFLKTFGIR